MSGSTSKRMIVDITTPDQFQQIFKIRQTTPNQLNPQPQTYFTGVLNYVDEQGRPNPIIGNKNVIAFFHRPGCGYCRIFKPEVEKAAGLDKSGTVYLRINLDDIPNLLSMFNATWRAEKDGVVKELPLSPLEIMGVPVLASFAHGSYPSSSNGNNVEATKFFSQFNGERKAENVLKFSDTIGQANVTFRSK